jgi:hypothetical protein
LTTAGVTASKVTEKRLQDNEIVIAAAVAFAARERANGPPAR